MHCLLGKFIGKVYLDWPVVGWGFVLFWVSFMRCPLVRTILSLLHPTTFRFETIYLPQLLLLKCGVVKYNVLVFCFFFSKKKMASPGRFNCSSLQEGWRLPFPLARQQDSKIQ